MTVNQEKWLGTLPNLNIEYNQEDNKLDYDKWISTLPHKNSTLPHKKKNNALKKYSLSIIIFVVGLVFVSAIKNQTRNLQKEISNLKASINTLRQDLHNTTLEHEFITSPENISRLAKEHLEFELISYKKSQIKQLNGKEEKVVVSSKIKKNKNKLKENIKSQIAKKIKQKKTEIRKLKELYYDPKSIPGEIRTKVAKQIKEKRIELKEIYNSPKEVITREKVKKWGVIQIVKAFLGVPIIPGR